MSDHRPGDDRGTGPVEINRVEARGGSTPGVTRYVLLVSMVLIVVLFAAVLIYWA